MTVDPKSPAPELRHMQCQDFEVGRLEVERWVGGERLLGFLLCFFKKHFFPRVRRFLGFFLGFVHFSRVFLGFSVW